jgi:Fic family protein
MVAMPVPHQWRPIADFDADPRTLTDGELISLKRVWEREKQEMAGAGTLEEFDKRLRREWAIETGIIENVYTLDRGVTRTLIEKGIDAALIPHGTSNRDSVVVARIIQDHYEALEGMFDFVGGQRELSAGYINQLHAALLRNQETYAVVDGLGRAFEKELAKGAYKTQPNSPTRPDGSVHEYAPPEHTAAEMDRLVELHAEHERSGVPVEVESAWLHHRFTQIHPFADGNGRVARAIASLVFIKAGWFPLVIKNDDRARYIEALERADAGDLRALVAMFVEAQRNALIQASEIAFEAKPVSSPSEAIAAARDRLIQRGRLALKEWLAVRGTATKLNQFAHNRFAEIARELNTEIANAGRGFGFQVGSRNRDAEVAAAVQESGQVAIYEEFFAAPLLTLNTGKVAQLVLSFHALGPRFRGLIGVVAFLSVENKLTLLNDGTFQINYEESPESAQARFVPWLERVIVAGLDQWRRTL